MRRLIIRARVAARLSGSPIDIFRTASFALADHCPDAELIEAVPQLVSSRRDPDERAGDLRLREHLEKIAVAYGVENHPLAKFASCVCYQDGDKVYEEAMNCGLHSDEREFLIQTGFISDPILTLLKCEGTKVLVTK
jgi:hypothetical protein